MLPIDPENLARNGVFGAIPIHLQESQRHRVHVFERPPAEIVQNPGRVAQATARGIREIANAINETGGSDAIGLRIAEQYLNEFGKLAMKNNTMVRPSNLSDVAGMVAAVSKVLTGMRVTPEVPAKS